MTGLGPGASRPGAAPRQTLDRSGYELEIEDAFSGPTLDERIWIPAYLPQWSSRAQAGARYRLAAGGLELLIEQDQPAWCPEFDGPLRTSSLQTGVRSGSSGSRSGQHRFRDDLVVREAQPRTALYTPRHGLFEVRASALADPANMVALWMIGFEDEPAESAEICVFEIFGRDVEQGSAAVGMGIHPFHDPVLVDDFERVRLPIDVREPHDYAVEWSSTGVAFYVDERLVKAVEQSPGYPMQFMLDIFELAEDGFPASPPASYPKVFRVEWFRGWRPIRGPDARAAAFDSSSPSSLPMP